MRKKRVMLDSASAELYGTLLGGFNAPAQCRLVVGFLRTQAVTSKEPQHIHLRFDLASVAQVRCQLIREERGE